MLVESLEFHVKAGSECEAEKLSVQDVKNLDSRTFARRGSKLVSVYSENRAVLLENVFKDYLREPKNANGTSEP
jgi:hypothetical protein